MPAFLVFRKRRLRNAPIYCQGLVLGIHICRDGWQVHMNVSYKRNKGRSEAFIPPNGLGNEGCDCLRRPPFHAWREWLVPGSCCTFCGARCAKYLLPTVRPKTRPSHRTPKPVPSGFSAHARKTGRPRAESFRSS